MMDAFYPHVVSHHSRLNILRNKRRGRPKNEEGQVSNISRNEPPQIQRAN